MRVSEDELKKEIREGIEENNKQFLVKLLVYCYSYSEEDIQDAEAQFEVGRGEVTVASGSSDILEHVQYDLRTKGRQFALIHVVGNMFQYFGTDIRPKIITMVEICELNRLLETNQFMGVNIHLCSFLENYLEDEANTEASSLYYQIRTARDEDVLTEEQEQLAQFIREVRNDAAHNFWLETEWSFVIHEFAAIAGITLLDDMLEEMGVSSMPVDPELSLNNAIRVIEAEFEFEWLQDDRGWSNSPRERYQREYDWG